MPDCECPSTGHLWSCPESDPGRDLRDGAWPTHRKPLEDGEEIEIRSADGTVIRTERRTVSGSSLRVSSLGEEVDPEEPLLSWDELKTRDGPPVWAGGWGASILTGETAPEDPEQGDLWYVPSTMKMMVWSGAEWLETVGEPPAPVPDLSVPVRSAFPAVSTRRGGIVYGIDPARFGTWEWGSPLPSEETEEEREARRKRKTEFWKSLVGRYMDSGLKTEAQLRRDLGIDP